MRITETRLRALIRGLLREAPLADLQPIISPPFSPGEKEQHDDTGDEAHRQKASRIAKKVTSSKVFADNMKKIMSGFEMEVSVLPVSRELGVAGVTRTSMMHRSELEGGDVEGLFGPEISEKVDSWNASAPDGACLFVMGAWLPEPIGRNFMSAYMLLHAMFDDEYFIQEVEEGAPTCEKIGGAWRSAMSLMNMRSWWDDEEVIKGLEQCFPNMKSAVSGSYSKHGAPNVNDWVNDVLVHCILKKGFSYSPEKLEEFCELHGFDFDIISSKFDQIVSLRPAFRQEFMSWIRNQVIFVNV